VTLTVISRLVFVVVALTASTESVVGILLCPKPLPPAISMLVEKRIDRVFDREKIVVTPDHFKRAKDIKSAELHKRLDEWAKRHKIEHYYKLGPAGVCHALHREQGHIRPGGVIVGGDCACCGYGQIRKKGGEIISFNFYFFRYSALLHTPADVCVFSSFHKHLMYNLQGIITKFPGKVKGNVLSV